MLKRTNSDTTPTHLRCCSVSIFFAPLRTIIHTYLLTRWDRPDGTHHKTLFIMAKGNMLLGHARGKVGSVVFSRANGKQITRALAEQVKNPRTDGQNVQRAIFATVNGFASAVRDIVDHSFQSYKEGSASVNRFVSINVKKLRELYLSGAACDIMPKGAGLPYANPYRFSIGSLGMQRLLIGTVGAARYFGVYQETDWEGNIEDAAQMQACIPAFAPGCEIAVIKVYYNETEHFHFVTKDRAVFKSSFDAIDPSYDIVTSAGLDEAYLDMNKTTDVNVLHLVGGSSGNKILAVSENLNDAVANTLVAAVVIVSRKDSAGNWQYTTSDMVCDEGWSEAHDLTAAINSYGNASKADTTSEQYLQQSSQTQQGGDVTPMAEIEYNLVAQGSALSGGTQYENNSGDQEWNLETAAQVGGWAIIQMNFPTGGNTIKKVQTRYTNEQGVVDNARMTQSSNKAGNVVTVETVLNQINDSTALGGVLDFWVISGSGEQVHYTINFEPMT